MKSHDLGCNSRSKKEPKEWRDDKIFEWYPCQSHRIWWYEDISGGISNGEVYHRSDGPFAITALGRNRWWWDDIEYKFLDWLDENNILTDEEKALLILEWL